jgi:hypothetical protein
LPALEQSTASLAPMPTGHLIYVRLGTLMAIPFDPGRLAVTGERLASLIFVQHCFKELKRLVPTMMLGDVPRSCSAKDVEFTGVAA